jgi:hypothetical protein
VAARDVLDPSPLHIAPSLSTSGSCFSVQAAAACFRADSVGGGKSAGSSA